MGEIYSRPERMPSQIGYSEKEILLASYKSDEDIYYEMQEKKYNYLRNLNFQDFLYSLVNFSDENFILEDDYSKSNINYSMNHPFFNETFSSDIFQSFIDSKILRYKNIFTRALNGEHSITIFKTYLLVLHKSLILKLTQNKRINGVEIKDKDSITKKCDAISYGLLYCSGPNYVKAKAIFNIFSENGQLKPSKKFNEFLLVLFLIACYCNLYARNRLSMYDEIGPFEKQKFKEFIKFSELKECQNLVKKTNELIFGSDLSAILNYEQFKKKFTPNDKDNSIGFILCPSGIRYMLHKYAN